MDDWRVNDWRSPPMPPQDVNEERRGTAADGDEDRAIRRFLAATEHASSGELRVLRPLVVSPIWLLAVGGFLFALGLIWMQLNMLGTNLPPI